ncbi:MAG: diguanylate cyclase [Magnetococcales bacterium]|nr:diguanylate cyclase [Magnetococcales bacterium]
MKPAAELLEQVYDRLRAPGRDTDGALRLLQELTGRDPCQAELTEAKGLLAALVRQLLVPALAKSPAAEGALQGLLVPLEKEGSLEGVRFVTRLKELIPHMTALGEGESVDRRPPPELPQVTAKALASLAHSHPWIVKGSARLADASGTGVESWEALSAFLGQIVTREEQARRVWQRQRQEFRAAMVRVAESFSGALRDLGRTDGELTAVAGRIQEAGSLADLVAAKELLLAEATQFRERSQVLQGQVEQSQNLARKLRERVRGLDQAMGESQDRALNDPFTGLPNRYLFAARFRSLTEEKVELRPRRFALILIKMDNYPALVEAVGRPESHRLVAGLAKRIQGQLVGEDYLARIGESALGIWLADAALKEATARVRELAQVIARTRFKLAGQSLAVECSFGVVFHRPGVEDEAMLAAGFSLASQAREERRPMSIGIQASGDHHFPG